MKYIYNNGLKSVFEREYILFNSDKKTKAKIDLAPKLAERLRYIFGLVPVGKKECVELGLNDFKEVTI